MTKAEAINLYKTFGTWEKAAAACGVQKGQLFRIANHEKIDYSEKIGNKKNEIQKIWENLSFFSGINIHRLVDLAIKTVKESTIEIETIRDYLIFWILSRKYFKKTPSLNETKKYLYCLLRNECRQYQRDAHRRIQFVFCDDQEIGCTDSILFWRDISESLSEKELETIYRYCFLGEDIKFSQELKNKIKNKLKEEEN